MIETCERFPAIAQVWASIFPGSGKSGDFTDEETAKMIKAHEERAAAWYEGQGDSFDEVPF